MPERLIAWVQAFVDRHHVDEPFRKRRRDRIDTEALASPADAGAPTGHLLAREDAIAERDRARFPAAEDFLHR